MRVGIIKIFEIQPLVTSQALLFPPRKEQSVLDKLRLLSRAGYRLFYKIVI